MGGTDNEVLIGTGVSPDGVKVFYYEMDRPGTMGAPGATGYIVEVRNENGQRITHSDTLKGLQSAGFKVDKAPAPEPEPVAEANAPVADVEAPAGADAEAPKKRGRPKGS